MIRAVTVDAAGTLIAPSQPVGTVYAEVASAHGLSRDAAVLEAAFLPAFKAMQERWGVPYGADEADARRFWHAVIAATFAEPLPPGLAGALFDTFATAERWQVLPGAHEALALIASCQLPLAVVSNFDGRLPGVLEALGLGPFQAMVISAEVGCAKPHPAPLLTACRRLAVTPDQVLHLGDSEREDGGMCQATGARWLRCAGGIPLAELAGILRP